MGLMARFRWLNGNILEIETQGALLVRAEKKKVEWGYIIKDNGQDLVDRNLAGH